MLCPILSMCSSITIRGNVINSYGSPVPGAVIIVQNTNKKAISDSNGEFTIKGTKLQDSIQIVCKGYYTATEPNNERGLITVLLKRKLNRLNNHILKPLSVGDTIPPFLLSNTINWPVSEISLDELSNQLIILDFWATWCTSCLKGFSKLDSLQKQFPKKLQPILVNDQTTTGNTEQAIRDFISKRNQSAKTSITLPVSIEATNELTQLFPHIYLPHYVWIAPGGVVVAITSASELTKENILSILGGKPNSMKLKSNSP